MSAPESGLPGSFEPGRKGPVCLVKLPIVPVGLADVDPDRRRFLARALQRGGLHLVLERSEPSALLNSDEREFEVAVLGTETLGPDVLDSVAFLKDGRRRIRVIVVSEVLGNGRIRGAFDAGVDAVVDVGEASRCLVLAVRSALAGQLTVPRKWRPRLRTPVLSRRQKQILAMVVMGFSNRRIARTLGVAESTVKSHLTTAFRRLGVSSRGEAAATILDPENGLGPGILGIPGDQRGDARIRPTQGETRENFNDEFGA